MSSKRRVDLRGILAKSDLRRDLMIPTIQATQAREGIETTREQAERAYYVVTEAERVAFFALRPFGSEAGDEREAAFARAVGRNSVKGVAVRYDVERRDFATLEGSPLTYAQVRVLAQLVRDSPRLDPVWADVRGGMNSTESERFVRHWWEPSATSTKRWVRYSKGGNYARFYADLDLVFDWTMDGAELRSIVKRKYGSESRFVKSPEFYFKRGLTWTEKSRIGFSVRILEEGAIFNVAGPAAFPKRQGIEWYLLGILNSTLIDYVAWAFSRRNYGASYIGALPIVQPGHMMERVSDVSRDLFAHKARWDEGNETSTRFSVPWLLVGDLRETGTGIAARLERLAVQESDEESYIQGLYAKLNDEVYKLYSIPDSTRTIIEETLGERRPEVLWPQMEGKAPEQKRMEHVFRLLSYAVKRVVEADEDGIVPFAPVAGEASLADRVLRELEALFPALDVGHVEAELANELKKNVKGYRRTSGIAEWLEDAFFHFHCSMYKKRPIFWHIASRQGTSPCVFSALVHYHRFDKNRMAQLRGQYVRDAMETFRREAALADKDRRASVRQDWLARLEEAQELDRRLQRVHEGHHDGPYGSDTDYRILTPWKAPDERPNGWEPDVDDGVKVNIAPLQKAGVLRVAKVV